MLVTIGTALITLTTIYYLYHRGGWDPESNLAHKLAGCGGIAVLVSFALGCVSIRKERPRFYGAIALCLSVFSFLLYVQ